MVDNRYDLLLALKQEGTVKEYQKLLKKYVAPLQISKWQYLKGIFLNGLEEEVRVESKLHHVETLTELMDLVELVDNRNQVLLKRGWVNVAGLRNFSRDSLFNKSYFIHKKKNQQKLRK